MHASSNPIALALLLLIAFLAPTTDAIPNSYLKNPSCAAYLPRISAYYTGRHSYSCPAAYGTPFVKPRLAFTSGGNTIRINNLNRVHINAAEPVAAPVEGSTGMTEQIPAGESSTATPTTPADATPSDQTSMAAQSEIDEGAPQASLYKRLVHKVRKVVYTFSPCLKLRAGACTFTRPAKIVPSVVPYALPPPPANHIVVNDKNMGRLLINRDRSSQRRTSHQNQLPIWSIVILNAPAVQPQREVIQINMPSQPAPQPPVYVPAPQPAVTPFVVTQPAPVIVTVTHMATPPVQTEIPVIETIDMPTSTVIVMVPTYQATQEAVPCAGTACVPAAPCEGSCVSTN
ncbi:hypothetical protein BC938DRAFT_475312 [Jimgerdemannia flammicorona]|uniref:Uncharacterized protein n=1 Tax=Jimgerdemannia flammicorona TaxID=994334 RepID=A0A433PWW3_9FUNG|nr:hypothetical protein BC938DRAFT_475312 [Jimgerdemannia flammicorona]